MNKTALITGSSNGIGYEFAKIHAEKGDDLVLVARTKSKLDELKKELEEKYNIKVYRNGSFPCRSSKGCL
jgi:short-subunit dehydrogenase